jgi:hypothetical protein
MAAIVNYQDIAKDIVFDFIRKSFRGATHPTFARDEIYVVWFAKTLQNWKVVISTTLPEGDYYEVTFNGNKREAYLDVYKKMDNIVVMLDA